MSTKISEQTPQQRAEMYFNQSYAFFMNKNFAHAVTLCNKALKIYPRCRNALLRLGNIYSILQHYDDASNYYNRFYRYSTEAEDAYDISRAYNAMGYLDSMKGNLNDALKNYQMSLEISRSLRQSKEVARSYNNIALAYRRDRQFDTAFHYYKKALEISKKANHLDRLAYYYFNIAIMFKEEKRYFKAFRFLRKFKKVDKIIKKKGGYVNPKDEIASLPA